MDTTAKLFSCVRYLNIKSISRDDMKSLIECFNVKSKQIEEELRRRNNSGEIISLVSSPNKCDITNKDDVFTIVTNTDVRRLTVRQLVHLMDLFNIKTRQMKEEICYRQKT